MKPKLSETGRKRVVFYMGQANYYHLVKKVGDKPISEWVRTLVEREVFK